MKCVCEGIDLSDAVLKVVKACSSKTTVPVLECIKLSAKNDKITLSATDGEISIIRTINSEIYEEGEVCVPGKYFADFIKKLEGVQISLSSEGKTMEIAYADSQTTMQVLSADDFPRIDLDITENSFALNTSDLKDFIRSTTFCCASDDSRPILKGCQFVINGDEICVTSLDGFRLGTVKGKVMSSTGNMEIICPARTLNEIDIRPQETIIPKNIVTEFTVEKDKLKASIERAAILVRNDKNSLILFDISGDQIQISSASEIGNVQEPVKAEVSGKDVKIAMNSKFIIDAVNALQEDMITLSFNNHIQPFICQNKENKDKLYLILPVRTGSND